MLENFRTRLRDVVFGRTRIRVVSLGEDSDLVPVFLVGTFRSGTTLLRYLLDTHTQICAPPETKFLTHLAEMLGKDSTKVALESMGLEDEYIKRSIRHLASAFYAPYKEAKGKPILVDKTPDYVRILDFIDWLYDGKCRYIMLFRNGLDVAESMNSTPIEPLEGDKSIDAAFEYWRTDTQILLDWQQSRPETCCKVVYESLCSDVPGVMSNVLGFLGLQWEPRILEWYRDGHDRGHEDIKARRQQKIVKSAGNYEAWDSETVSLFKEKARELHVAIGYDPDTLEMR